MLFAAIKEQLDRICRLDDDVNRLEKRMAAWKKQDESCKAVAEIPGIGLLTATALVATVGNAKAFRSGREFAAFVGLVPRQSGTGGKIRLGAISKRGDPYLRTLLIHGARAVLWGAKEKGAWVESLAQRRPPNVAVVALANKMARTAWAIMAHESRYDRSYGATAA
jgi:transposase